ncbi:MAG TPA: hypothetical protein VF541_21560 [Longimicrobium sp.]
MRIHLALALLLCAAATPLRAQDADSVFHGGSFDVVLPAGYPPMLAEPEEEQENGDKMEMYVSPRGDDGVVMVLRAGVEPTLNDTALATRRAFLQIARAGMMQAKADMRPLAEPREVLRDDRVGLRMPVAMENNGDSLRGSVEMSVPRQGPLAVWLVMSFTGRDASDERVMDSFRLTGGPSIAMDRGPADVFEWVAGRWNWANRPKPCRDNPFTLTVAPDRRSVRLEYARAEDRDDTTRIFVYRVLGSGRDHILGQIEGEPRKDGAGKSVAWDFVRMSRDAFCWRRADWAQGQCTPPLRRCPAPSSTATGTGADEALPAPAAGRARGE